MGQRLVAPLILIICPFVSGREHSFSWKPIWGMEEFNKNRGRVSGLTLRRIPVLKKPVTTTNDIINEINL